MKYLKMFFAAVLAIFLTACSFFNNKIDESNNTYQCQIILEGGSGKATVESPATVVDSNDLKTVKLVWSSSNYDYMLVDGIRFLNEASQGENSTFTIPFSEYDKPFSVIGDTTAMSTPHEIEYELTVLSPGTETQVESDEDDFETDTSNSDIDLGKLVYDSSYDLQYAKEFSIDYYHDDNNKYALITIGSGQDNQYFLKCIDGELEETLDLSDNICLLDDLDNTYLVSTSVMDLIVRIDALSYIKFTGTDANNWYISEAKAAINEGTISYAGKYSSPDFEMLVAKACNFAIENTMIYHSPEIKEKLEEVGIPVLVERSSYEDNPLGRLEWVKLYGLLYDKLELAEAFFDDQVQRANAVLNLDDTGKSVAFFSINSNGQIVVRKNNDYISTMIEMAGADYVPENLGERESNLATLKISAEDFYIGAVDADVLIYNSTITGEVTSINQLLTEMPSLADFKAVKEGNVYCLKQGYFQMSGDVAEFIEGLHNILIGENPQTDCFIRVE